MVLWCSKEDMVLRASCTGNALGWWLGNMQILVMYPFYRVGGGELRGEWVARSYFYQAVAPWV